MEASDSFDQAAIDLASPITGDCTSFTSKVATAVFCIRHCQKETIGSSLSDCSESKSLNPNFCLTIRSN